VKLSIPFQYELYGQTVQCERPLDLPSVLTPGGRNTIRLTDQWPEILNISEPESWFEFSASDSFRTLQWRGVGDFAVFDGGRQIGMRLNPRTPWSVVQSYLLTQVVSEALIQMGEESLHGVAVEWNGRASLFLGSSGLGKSTLLTQLLSLGAKFISDDLLVLNSDRGVYGIYRGLPRIKLYEDSHRISKFRFGESIPLSPYTDKRMYSVPEEFVCGTPCVDVKAVYILTPTLASEPSRIELVGFSKFQALAENVFNTIDGTSYRRKINLRALTELSGLPVFQFNCPNQMSRLPEVAQWAQSTLL